MGVLLGSRGAFIVSDRADAAPSPVPGGKHWAVTASRTASGAVPGAPDGHDDSLGPAKQRS
jgi:hypothetical protein